MPRRLLVTAALPYANGRLHVGHIAGAYLPADTYVRYLRARGEDVRFVCGSDDNGVASLISARREGRSVVDLTAHYHARQAADFQGLGIRFDVYGGTHQPDYVQLHERLSQDFFRAIHAKGYFSKRSTQQLFDAQAGQFLPDRFVQGTCYHRKTDGTLCGFREASGDQCEACGNAIDPMQLVDPVSTITGTRPEPRETVHWFLQLSRFEEPLRRWLEEKRTERPAWRDMVLNFSLGLIKQGLPERSMTRDLDWGVPVPLDDPDAARKMLYVWFDAPIGYISFTSRLCERSVGDWRRYAEWWKDPGCRIVHFLGEDNVVFHALIWPAMLLAEGSYQLPWQVVANCFLNVKFAGEEEQKFSKSRGTAIWIEDYLEVLEPDPLRFYLTAIAPESQRTTFSPADFITRNNTELLNTLGNFVHRTMTFTHRYLAGKVPEPGQRQAIDREQLAAIGVCAGRATEHLEAFRFRIALGEVMALARLANGYFDARQPWKQRKEDPAGCATTINVCLQTVKALATLMAPFLPFSAEKCARMLTLEELPWDGATVELPAGHALGEATVLYRKLEPDAMDGIMGIGK